MNKKYLILGSGIAGFSAACKIREYCPEAEITMVSAEKENPYLRPLLSKTDFRTFQRDKIRLADEKWYADRKIRMLKGVRVERIAPGEHTVRLSNGETLPYDKCIYALGADCFVPPIPGAEKEGVFTLRTVEDYLRLRRYALRAKNVVLVGGGIIGLEMAWELCKMGLGCTILEAAPKLMGRQLDTESSALMTEHIRLLGIGCHAGVQVTELTGENAVTGVRLGDGRWFPGDVVLLSTGVRPVMAPAAEAGLACNRGVVVDDSLMTSDPDIYAAGDCISCSIPNPGLWKYARISGEIAGHNTVYPEQPQRFAVNCFPVVLSTMGTNLFSLGDITEDEQVEIVRDGFGEERRGLFRVNRHEGDAFRHQKSFYRGGELRGAVFLGDISNMAWVLEQLGGGV